MLLSLASTIESLSLAKQTSGARAYHSQHPRSSGMVKIPLSHKKRARATASRRSGARFAQQQVSSKFDVLNLHNQESFFSGPVGIGNPPQEFNMVFDTGSDYVIVPSVYCDSDMCKASSNQFDPGKSSSYISQTPKKLKEKGEYRSLYVKFGSGSVLAVLGEDQVTIGDLVVPQMKFGQIVQDNLQVGNVKNLEGILGMGSKVLDTKPVSFDDQEDDVRFRQAASSNAKFMLWRDQKGQLTQRNDNMGVAPGEIDSAELSFMTSIVHKNVLTDHNLFSFFFSNQKSIDGIVTFGGYDETMVEDEVRWNDVVTDDIYWQIKLDDIKVNGKSLGLCPSGQCTAIVDTGTTLLLAPGSFVKKITEAIDFKEDCSNLDALSDITFTFGGHDYDLPKENYVMVDEMDEVKVVEKDLAGGKKIQVPMMKASAGCAMGVLAHDKMDIGFYESRSYGKLYHQGNKGFSAGGAEESLMNMEDAIILGNIFLKRFLSVYDVKNRKVGFAKAVHSSSDVTPDISSQIDELNQEIEAAMKKTVPADGAEFSVSGLLDNILDDDTYENEDAGPHAAPTDGELPPI